MASSLFRGADREQVAALAELIYTNPFSGERRRLERVVLGDAYVEPGWTLLPGQPLHRLEGNLRSLVDRAEAVLEAVRPRAARLRSVSERDRALYEALVHFVIFHRLASGFDALIGVGCGLAESVLVGDGGGRGRRSGGAAVLFDRFLQDVDRYAAVGAVREAVRGRMEEWFGFYFQVRRAWVHTFAFIHGGSEAIRRLRARVWQSVFTHDMRRYVGGLYARMSDIPTLITGPSGTGKELVARAIGLSRFIPFDARARAFAADFEANFLPLNLSALSAPLIESELFGHRRGAFTGALADRDGYFETCGPYGTVFLDEIGETAPEIQVKLLRVLQTRQFNRLGDTAVRLFRGRVVAATNRDLAAEVRAGRFREDFFYRLCGDRIETPGLAEVLAGDENELACIVAHLAARLVGDAGAAEVTDEVVAWIRRHLGMGYPWPGNFRELEQCVRNIVVHGHYEPLPEGNGDGGRGGDWLEAARAGQLSMDGLLHHYCRAVVERAGSLEGAARRLGVDRRTVRRYLRLSPE